MGRVQFFISHIVALAFFSRLSFEFRSFKNFARTSEYESIERDHSVPL